VIRVPTEVAVIKLHNKASQQRAASCAGLVTTLLAVACGRYISRRI